MDAVTTDGGADKGVVGCTATATATASEHRHRHRHRGGVRQAVAAAAATASEATEEGGSATRFATNWCVQRVAEEGGASFAEEGGASWAGTEE